MLFYWAFMLVKWVAARWPRRVKNLTRLHSWYWGHCELCQMWGQVHFHDFDLQLNLCKVCAGEVRVAERILITEKMTGSDTIYQIQMLEVKEKKDLDIY